MKVFMYFAMPIGIDTSEEFHAIVAYRAGPHEVQSNTFNCSMYFKCVIIQKNFNWQ